MAKQFFKDLPDTTTPLTASRLNGLLDGEEAMGSIVVDNVSCKNMLNPYTFINGNIDSSGNYNSNQVNYLSDYIEVQPNTKYIASANANQAYFQISEFDSSKTFIQRTSLTNTSTNAITTTATTKYVRVSYNKDNSTTMTRAILLGFEPQFELGETRTTYTPYNDFDNTLNNKNVLYSNPVGNSGTINLRGDADDYEYLEIFGQELGGRDVYTKIWKNSSFVNQRFILGGQLVIVGNTDGFIRTAVYSISSSNTIEVVSNNYSAQFSFTTAPTITYNSGPSIRIYRVVGGYK